MDAACDPKIERGVVKSSAQVGKTSIMENIIGYHMDQDPAPMMVVQPTLEMAETFSKDRLAPMLRDTPCLQGTVKDARSRDSGNTLLHKQFPGGHITLAGANSPASLASRPIRIVLFDEVDRYPASVGTEGDPVNLGSARTLRFWNRRIWQFSTPTVEGASRIEASWQQSDQRRFYVPCPQCGEFQVLAWEQVKWENQDPETAHYECQVCQAHWDDARRWRAIRFGQWIATAPFRGIAGFHIWEAYAPGALLKSIVDAFLKAKDSPERLKTWINTCLGETWKEQGDAPDWEKLLSRRAEYRLGHVPEGVLFLTAGVDVQKDRLEWDVNGWGRSKQRWLIETGVIEGDPYHAATWDQLTAVLSRTYRHPGGADLGIVRMAVDSGYATQQVYAWARQQGPSRVMVVKGVDSGASLVAAPSPVDITVGGRKIKHGLRIYAVNVSMAKSELYGNLRVARPEEGEPFPPGYFHLPKDATEEYAKQLTAEQLVTRVVRGYRKFEWVKIRERNEALDKTNYNAAAAHVFGIDRFSEARWAQMARALQVETPVPAPEPVPQNAAPAKRAAPAPMFIPAPTYSSDPYL